MNARRRWADWLPLGLFLALAVWLVGGALLGPSMREQAPSATTVDAGAATAVLLPAPAPVEPTVPAAQSAAQSGVAATGAAPDAELVSPDWAAAAAVATGIPARALLGYAGAALRLAQERPDCGLGWTTLAALGEIESDHGRHNGSMIGPDGVTVPGIFGPALDGSVYDAFADTDQGRWDGDPVWDRAVGPLQFIPATWADWGADGDGDTLADPQQIDDAALAAGRYLCESGAMTSPTAWRAAVYSYNHVESYVDLVAATANGYAARMP